MSLTDSGKLTNIFGKDYNAPFWRIHELDSTGKNWATGRVYLISSRSFYVLGRLLRITGPNLKVLDLASFQAIFIVVLLFRNRKKDQPRISTTRTRRAA